MESVNFVLDVNTMRKTLKSVYSQSRDLRSLNAELGDGPGNCRVQGKHLSSQMLLQSSAQLLFMAMTREFNWVH